MRELNVNEIEEVNGGHPMLVIAAMYVGRKFGAKAAGFAIGALTAWFAE